MPCAIKVSTEAGPPVLYVPPLLTAGLAGAARPPGPRRPPVATVIAFMLTAVPLPGGSWIWDEDDGCPRRRDVV